jgi:3-dehydroquinate synthetase
LISETEYLEIKTTIKSNLDDIVFAENDIEPILELLIHDKKNEYGTIQFALIEGIGKIKINQSVENELILKLLMIINLNYFYLKGLIRYILFFTFATMKNNQNKELQFK